MTTLTRMQDIDLSGRQVLVRVDYNVPKENGRIRDDTRIRESLPTIQYLLGQGCGIVLMSHFGRPAEYEGNRSDLSLRPVASRLEAIMKDEKLLEPSKHVIFLNNEASYGAANYHMLTPRLARVPYVVMLENTRFNEGEESNDPEFARLLGAYGDVYVNDAFASAHNKHASTLGVPQYFAKERKPVAAGLLMEREVTALQPLLKPKDRSVAVFGGSKAKDKLGVIKTLAGKYDEILVGGGLASTFLKAAGYDIGLSGYEEEFLDVARRLSVTMPVDARIGRGKAREAVYVYDVRFRNGSVDEGLSIFDIGNETVSLYAGIIAGADTVLWNGPMGVFERDEFSLGTQAVGKAVAQANARGAYAAAGGGDTIAALNKYGLSDRMSYISTGGGAMLKFLERDGNLPAIRVLYND